LHLGHLSGPYIGGDIYKRYLKMKGTDAYYISGADDHQSYVPLKGEQVGLSPRYTADQFTEAMIQTLTSANVEMDLFVRPTSSPYHIQLVQKFFEKLYIEGKLIVKEVPSLYCEDCEKYLFEAHIRGKCPYCGAGSDGNACEQCGKPNDCVELVDPICKYCSTPPSTRPFTRLYFPLSKYEQQLRDYYKSVHMNAHLRSLCEKMLQEGLPDIPISHVSDWGIQVPVKGFENQRIYVWFEMAPGYLAATQQLNDVIGVPQHWQNFWKSSEAEVVQFFGFDNGYFHAVLFPAMFLAYDSEITLPKTFVTNEFLQLEGMKFSTSRGHAIWGQQFMKQVPVDIARFYLSYHRPETEQTNFSITDFKETVQRELFDGWQEWLKELGIKLSLEYNGKAPELGIWMEEHKHYYRKLSSLLKEACISYDAVTFSPQQITRLLSELVRVTRRFAKAEDHLSGLSFRQDERRTSVALELVAAKMLAILSAPIMPNFSSRLWKDLGYDLSVFSNTWTETPSFIPGGQKISNMDVPYFQEITYEEGNVKVTT
jgi:methionyl-tRNA synthetase